MNLLAYREYIQLEIKHSYFTGGYCPNCLMAVVQGSDIYTTCQMLMKNKGDGRFYILLDREKETLLNRCIAENDAELKLYLYVTDKNFNNYTANQPTVLTDNKLHSFVFNSATEQTATVLNTTLISSDIVLPVVKNFKPVAQISISCAPVSTNSTISTYSISFSPRMLYWRYYIIPGNSRLKETEVSIVKKGNIKKEYFKYTGSVSLPGSSSAWVFDSVKPIAASERPVDIFQLTHFSPDRQGRVDIVVDCLPSPSLHPLYKNETEELWAYVYFKL